MKVLVFDFWGDYGHFRKFFTTSSPLTFSFPPPSTIQGILGAIYGIEKENHLEAFNRENCKIALRIVNPVKKVRMGINFINTKDGHWTLHSSKYHEPRTQIRTEFLKNPYFRIYFSHKDEKILNIMSGLLKEHKSIYTLSMGLSELLADFKYVGEYNATARLENIMVEIQTPVILSNLINNELEIESGKKYFKERMPIVMNKDRIVEKYDDVVFEPDGKTIIAKVKDFYSLDNGENITFF